MMALLASAVMPKEGQVYFGELRPSRRREQAAFRRNVGWVPQRVNAMPGLNVREQVAYAGWLKDMPKHDAWDAAMPAIEKVGLADLAERPSKALSGGQNRRLGIAMGLVHRAKVLMLDEPSAGLDPLQREDLRVTLAQTGEHADLIVSTHDTDDMGSQYDHVVVLAGGSVRFQGTTKDFMELAERDGSDSARAAAAYRSLVQES